MNLKLTKPLIFLDIESTGLNVGADRIVEIALLKLNPDGSREDKTERINPGIPIPDLVSRIHGIYDKDVAEAPSFKQVAPALLRFIGTADFAGYNSNKFDIPLLAEEFLRAEVDFDLEGRRLIDVQNIFHFMEPRNLAAAYRFYCNKTMENAHSALYDAQATLDVFMAQLQMYDGKQVQDEKGNFYTPVVPEVTRLSELSSRSKNVDLAGRIVYNDKGEAVFSFGKHKDKRVVDVFAKEPSYYSWMMQGDFPLYTKRVITKIRLGMRQA